MINPHESNATVHPGQRPQRARPRIYMACLAAYNNGTLHGAWIEVTTPDHVKQCVQRMLAMSPEPHAEEWAIHDYEGFEGCNISEYASFETVCELADFISEFGELGAKIYNHFASNLDDARSAFENYAGEFRGAADFAEDLHLECGPEIPTSLKYYIDWEALARDMELNGEIYSIQLGFDEVHIFWNG